MSYYQYYQQQPMWGTQNWQMAAPPRPYFQPQSGWGGRQFFNAQAGLVPGYSDWEDDYGVREEGFFDGIFRGIRDMFARGMNREEARMYHRQVYGGLSPIDQLDSAQLGGAAGYEAARHWSTYRATYSQSFMGDMEREREALAGLAAGEAVKLMNYSQIARRRRSRREAAEIAAATAERLFAEDFEDPYGTYGGGLGYRARRRSIGVGEPMLRRRRSSLGGGILPVGGGVLPGEVGLGVGGLGVGARPLVATATGGTYMSAQPTGTSYISAQPTGVSYVSAGSPGMYPGGQQYVTTTGQPVQYVQNPGMQYVQPGYQGGVQYVQPGNTGYGYAAAGQQPLQYVQANGTGYPGGGVMFPASTGGSYMAAGGGLGVPAGYTRGRASSFGGGYVGGGYM